MDNEQFKKLKPVGATEIYLCGIHENSEKTLQEIEKLARLLAEVVEKSRGEEVARQQKKGK